MTEIEALLGKASPRLPWVMAGEAGQQRRVLEETYQYLKALPNANAQGGWGGIEPAPGGLTPDPVDPNLLGGSTEAKSQQILQALLQEMQYLRSQTLQPLRTEVMALQQQREQLLNEVRQLDQQRLQGTAQPAANALPPPLVDELVERLREALLNQLRPQFQSPPSSPQQTAALYGNTGPSPLEEGSDLPQLHPQQRLEQLRHIQAQTDYMLLKLDTNLRAVFESMEQSIQSYRDSLHQGLDSMHGLGQQGEVIFKTLVNHLAQQLGQEQTAYLDAAATAIPPQSHLAAVPQDNALENADIVVADLEDWRDEAEINPEVADSALSDDLPLSIDLDDLDLGEALDGDEDITLFQLDEEITQLQLDDDAIDPEDSATRIQPDEETLVQREPLPWPGIPGKQNFSAAGGTKPTEARNGDGEAANTEIDALYESLFGESEETPTPSDPETIASEPLVPDEPIVQALFETDAAPNDAPAAEDIVDLANAIDDPILPASDPLTATETGEITVEETTLDLAALDQSLGLFEMPAAIADVVPETFSDTAATPTLTDLIGADETPEPQASSTGAEPLEANTIESLADLFPTANEAATPLFEGLSPDLEMDEDSFIPAPSDEDLLSNPPGATPWDPELRLTADALDQLSVDLLNLEGISADSPGDSGESSASVSEPETQINSVPTSVDEPLSSLQALNTVDEPSPEPAISSLTFGSEELEPGEPEPGEPEPESLDFAALETSESTDNAPTDISPNEGLDIFDLEALDPQEPELPTAVTPVVDEVINLAPDDLSLQELSLELDWNIAETPASPAIDDPYNIDGPVSDSGDQSLELDNDWTFEALPLGDDVPEADATKADATPPADTTTDTSDLITSWAADISPEADASEIPLAPETDFLSTSLDSFVDELLTESTGALPAPPEPLSLGDNSAGLSFDDISFDLDLPSVAKNYVDEEVTPQADRALVVPQPEITPQPSLPVDDGLSLDSFDQDFNSAPDPGTETDSDTLDSFSLGDLDLNLNLDLETDLRLESPPTFEPPPTIEDDFFDDQLTVKTSNAAPQDGSKITTLESLDDLELFAPVKGNEQDVEPSSGDKESASKITTLESLGDLELFTTTESAEPLTTPQVDDGIDLFGDQEKTIPEDPAASRESTATIPLSLGSLDLFPNDGPSMPEEDTSEPLRLDDLDLFAAERKADEYPPQAESADQDPIELFPNDEVAPGNNAELDLSDPGLLDLFPPLGPETTPPASADLFSNDHEDRVDREFSQSPNREASTEGFTEPDPALTLETLLALDEPEPTLPDGLTFDHDLESELGPSEGLDPLDELDNALETSPPDLSFEALELAPEDTDILSSFQSASIVAPVVEAVERNAQLVAQDQSEGLTAQPQDPSGGRSTAPEQDWFLGIDFGTTGISAVLMNRFDGQAYPLYWTDTGIASTTAEPLFRLPTVAVFNGADGDTAEWRLSATGPSALTLNWQGESSNAARSRLATQLKAWLAVGIPYQEGQGNEHPQLQWSEHDTLSLHQVLAATQALLSPLSQLKMNRGTTAAGLDGIPIGAAGLDEAHLQRALQQLQGVVVGHGTLASDTYRINLREVILATQLVESASQVLFVEEAIAAVLSGLPDPSLPLEPQGSQTQTLYQCHWQGGTVMINAGASGTDLGIVNLPNPLSALSREDFTLRSLAYGGDALDLDIISQLLVPADRRQPRTPGASKTSQGITWDWQAASPEVQNGRWETLGLEALDLPRLAEPDLAARIRLRQCLESSPLGQSLLEAARHGKLILQNQAQFHLELGDQSWRVLRRDLESRILVPYIQRINQHLNALMSETGLSSQGIHQVICTGGNASFATIARWLRQKFPNATIIQDTYPSNRPPSCSRVAYGLVNLCRYPQALDGPRHQYSDYFLLREILQVIPDQPMPLQGIMHLLDQQGVNTEVCHQRILAILEGHLPPGLLPDMAGRSHLNAASLERDSYLTLMTDVLFKRQSGQIYAPNVDACQRMAAHLNTLMADKQQSLAEPLLAQLVTA